MTTTQAEALREACRWLDGDLFCIAAPWLLRRRQNALDIEKGGRTVTVTVTVTVLGIDGNIFLMRNWLQLL
jgi:hypothetical protein